MDDATIDPVISGITMQRSEPIFIRLSTRTAKAHRRGPAASVGG
ncbi:hypothetical protein U9R90_00475 [Streptomyces sp. E11-3]